MRCLLTTSPLKTTNQQISEARDLLILRVSIQKWQAKLQTRHEYHQQTYAMFESRRLKRAMDTWRMKLHAKRQIQWRDSMRSRMKVVRLNREKKLKNDAWAKWRQLYRSRLSAQHYSKHLLTQFFSRWRRRLAGVDAVEDTGETLVQTFDSRRVSKFWHIWRRASTLRTAESLLAERVNLRVMNDAMTVWKKRMWVTSVLDLFGSVRSHNISQAEHCHRRRIQRQIHQAEGARLLEESPGPDTGMRSMRVPNFNFPYRFV